MIAALSLREKAPISRFSRTVIREKIRRPSGDLADAALDDLVRRQRVDPLAVQQDLALARLRGCPEIVRSVVLLPAPFAPISVTISPSWTSMLMPCSAWMLP